MGLNTACKIITNGKYYGSYPQDVMKMCCVVIGYFITITGIMWPCLQYNCLSNTLVTSASLTSSASNSIYQHSILKPHCNDERQFVSTDRKLDRLFNSLYNLTTMKPSDFCVAGHLWGQSTHLKWIPITEVRQCGKRLHAMMSSKLHWRDLIETVPVRLSE